MTSDVPSHPSELTLDSLALGGDAVGRAPAVDPSPAGEPRKQVVFVPYGAPGDRVALTRWEPRKNFARAWIQSVAEASPQRVDAPCPYFFKPGSAPETVCGGCDWQHLGYAHQTQAKRQLLVETFQRMARIANPPVGETIACPDPWRYRNKVQIPFAQRDGQLVAGFYAPNSHHIVPFDDCLVQTEGSVRIFKTVLAWFKENPVEAYNSDTGQGWLRHLLIRNNAKGEALVAIVSANDQFPRAVEFAAYIKEHCPFVKSLFHNVNPKPGNVVLGPEWRHLNGRHFLEETLSGLRFRLSPGAFFQVNRGMAEKLYKRVVDYVAPDLKEGVLELYAGVGAISQLLAPKAGQVWAVEENPHAVEDGIQSAQWNNIANIKYIASKCETALARGRFKRGPNDVLSAVVVDPPRAGCEQNVLRAIMRLSPRRIVYVSCDPATLARDARYLATGGYLLRQCTPVDLFPQTAHIESVSQFSKNI